MCFLLMVTAQINMYINVVGIFSVMATPLCAAGSALLAQVTDPDKMLLFNQKVLIFFLFLHENICCGYSLEVPH